jgi:hypothetical protein
LHLALNEGRGCIELLLRALFIAKVSLLQRYRKGSFRKNLKEQSVDVEAIAVETVPSA